ncbi:hypothetical protein AGR56_17950 [Clostridium sp. DMHC 10]|uniref:MATE family efflux transporter n=1 Tax=Clostridium sp. DMHC 10 TaxID=747377 RepID=UPI00069D4C0F|nr:MATE family efflux transporter [Clostridium sp. DMHC 10]KOF55716.1 hypothetical protein AGR56_17950 [Clostridium sp. DMHC 10]
MDFHQECKLFVGTGYFTLLLLIIGMTGKFNLSCANIAFTIESMSVWTVQGIRIAVGIIVGNEIGARRINNTEKILKKGLTLGFLFNIILIIVFNLFPDVLISLFNSGSNKKNFSLHYSTYKNHINMACI